MKKPHFISVFLAILSLLALNCRFLNSLFESIKVPVVDPVSKKNGSRCNQLCVSSIFQTDCRR
ncbi:MAG: hypothetical protein PVI26_11625 [Chitinispirillia bacterium]